MRDERLAMQEVRARVLARAAAVPGVARVEPEHGNAYGLLVYAQGGPERQGSVRISIANLYDSYLRQPGALDALIDRLVAPLGRMCASVAAGQSYTMPQTWLAARAGVYLRLDRQDRLDEIHALAQGQLAPLARPWIVSGLRLAVVFDGPSTMQIVSSRELARWGVEPAVVFAAAERRLRELTRRGPAITQRGPLYALATQDGYAAARLLATAELRGQLPRHLRQARMVVAIPRRDLMLLIPGSRDDLAAPLLSALKGERSPYPLTRTLFDWEGDTLTPIRPRPPSTDTA